MYNFYDENLNKYKKTFLIFSGFGGGGGNNNKNLIIIMSLLYVYKKLK